MEEVDPDDPARQDEVARRLMAYAEKLRAEGVESDDLGDVKPPDEQP